MYASGDVSEKIRNGLGIRQSRCAYLDGAMWLQVMVVGCDLELAG